MTENKNIVCFNCGCSVPEKNFSMREDFKCKCGAVLVKKPETGGLPGTAPKYKWDKRHLDEYVLPRKRFTNRLGG
jgi:hypothetical protein